MEELLNANDFKWYKLSLDVSAKYSHHHYGEPEKYPARVTSEWWDDPGGRYSYNHSFRYQREVVCEKCGHKTMEWE